MSNRRKCVLVVIALAILAAFVWPIWKRSPKNAPAAKANLWPTDPDELVALGHQHGHNGDWKQAHEYFRRVIAAGSASENDFLWATGAALAAGDTNACEEFCRSVLVLFGNDSTPDVAERCAKQVLPLPNAPVDLIEKAAQRADYAAEKVPNSGWKQLAKGMAEYRRGRWGEALKWLAGPERGAQTEIAVQAWPFGAMARHQLGDAAGARNALNELNRLLAQMVQKGELCDPRHNTWDNVARAVAARAEAERLIFGAEISPPLSSTDIVQNRKRQNDAKTK
jgi:uncharacterized protein HemY